MDKRIDNVFSAYFNCRLMGRKSITKLPFFLLSDDRVACIYKSLAVHTMIKKINRGVSCE